VLTWFWTALYWGPCNHDGADVVALSVKCIARLGNCWRLRVVQRHLLWASGGVHVPGRLCVPIKRVMSDTRLAYWSLAVHRSHWLTIIRRPHRRWGGNKKGKKYSRSDQIFTFLVFWHRVSLCSYHSCCICRRFHVRIQMRLIGSSGHLSSRHLANIGLEIRTCRNANARPGSTNLLLLLHGDESTDLGYLVELWIYSLLYPGAWELRNPAQNIQLIPIELS
jgi:hypothetical protein